MRSRLRYASVAFLIASVPLVLMLLATRGEQSGPQQPLWQSVAYGAAEWYPWALVAPLIDWRARRSRPRTRADRVRVFAGHVALAAGFMAAHGSLMYAVRSAIYSEGPRSLVQAIRSESVPVAILYTAITVVFTIAEGRRRQTEVAERLRAELAETRLDALRQQLNPHFLFNTLNHIVSELRSLRSDQVKPALAMLLALSDLLRDVLRERAQLIPLRDEVRMVERYLEIERARFGDRLQATVVFEPRTLDALVPSLLLQPLLENAMRHGVSAVDGTCRLQLAVRTHGERLSIQVQDAGPGIDPTKTETMSGVGLRNTAERLSYLYGDDHSFDLRPLDGGGLLVAIDLPLRSS
jgi:two-component system, LytTR family, sensor kinase